MLFINSFLFKDFIDVFLEREESGEKNISPGELRQSVASRAPPTGEPGLQPRHVLTGNQTHNLSVCGLNPLSHSSQGATAS